MSTTTATTWTLTISHPWDQARGRGGLAPSVTLKGDTADAIRRAREAADDCALEARERREIAALDETPSKEASDAAWREAINSITLESAHFGEFDSAQWELPDGTTILIAR